MKKVTLLLFLGTVMLWGQSRLSYGIGLGQSKNGIDIYRVAMQKPYEPMFYQNSYFLLTGYHEGSFNVWQNDQKNVYALAYSPVFTAEFVTNSGYTPYIEAGIGFSLISDTFARHKNMSSHFQFEDRLGVGIKTEKTDIYLRYMHYSNAGIKKPNDGLDLFMVGFRMKI